KACSLGRAEWSADRKTLYAPVVCPAKTKGESEFSVAEIPLNAGSANVRLTRIVHLTASDDNFASFFYVSLSPDKHTLATATGSLESEKIARADRALYLIALDDPDRKVTKHPIPQSAAPAGKE